MSAQVVSINRNVEDRSDRAIKNRMKGYQKMLSSHREALNEMKMDHMQTPFADEFNAHLERARLGMFNAYFKIREEMEK